MSLGPPAASRRFLALADGLLNPQDAKTAVGALRFIPEQVRAVLDRGNAGRTAGEVLGFPAMAPVVASVAEGRQLGANALLIGIAPVGGDLPAEWRQWILEGLEAGMDAWSGLHLFLAEDPEFAAAAARGGARIVDLRRVPHRLPVAAARAAALECSIVLTVGSDCNVGKMTSALQLHRAAAASGRESRFVATGQTGIVISGAGLAVDRVIADFMAGAAEQLVLEAAGGSATAPREETSGAANAAGNGAGAPDVIFVEGQGSLFHPGYSGVTLALLHGAAPSHLVLCHQPSRHSLRHGLGPLPGYRDMIRAYETAAAWVRPARVVAIALNTFDLDESSAAQECRRAREETGLPAADFLRHGASDALEAVALTARGAKRLA